MRIDFPLSVGIVCVDHGRSRSIVARDVDVSIIVFIVVCVTHFIVVSCLFKGLITILVSRIKVNQEKKLWFE